MVFSIKKRSVEEFEVHIAKGINVVHVKSGKITIISRNCFCSLRSEDTMLISPNESYILRDIGGGSKIIEVVLDDESFVSRSLFSESKMETGCISDPDIPKYLEDIYRESSSNDISREKLNGNILGLLKSFKSNLHYNNIVRNSLYENSIKEYQEYRMVLGIVEYVQENALDENLRLSALGEVFNTSYSFLSKKFREKSGICISEYLSRYRFNKSCELLKETNKMVSQVAYESGFGNVRNLNRAFNRYLGMTPTEFKNKETIFSVSLEE